MIKEFFIFTIFLSGIARPVAGSPVDNLCSDNDMTMVHKEIILGQNGQKHYYQIFCGCNCQGDANSLVIYERLNGDTVQILVDLRDILSFSLLGTKTEGMRDLAVAVRENPNESYSGHILDTLMYNGTQYVKHTRHTDRIETSVSDSQFIRVIQSVFDPSLKNQTNNSLASVHSAALTVFKSGQKLQAAQSLLTVAGPKPWSIDKNNIAIFNDLGFFLEQSGKYADAVDVLSAVITSFPDRTPAYLNLGDAYAGLKDSSGAKTNYQKYIDLMTKSGKQSKIPKRVLEAVK